MLPDRESTKLNQTLLLPKNYSSLLTSVISCNTSPSKTKFINTLTFVGLIKLFGILGIKMHRYVLKLKITLLQ